MFHGKRGCSHDINTINWMKYSLSCVLQGTTAGWNMYAWLLGTLMRPLVLTPQKGMRFCIFCRLFSYLALLTTRDWTTSSMTTRFGSRVQFDELKCGMLQWWSNLKMLSTASMPFAACDLWSVLHVLVFISNAYGIYTNVFWFVTFAISLTLSLDQFCAKREGNPTTISCATSYWASLCPFHQKNPQSQT